MYNSFSLLLTLSILVDIKSFLEIFPVEEEMSLIFVSI